jgi:hypothetical protein
MSVSTDKKKYSPGKKEKESSRHGNHHKKEYR